MRLAVVVSTLIAAALAAPAGAVEVLVTIDKSAQTLSVAADGVSLHSWPVSTGRPRYATPTGEFRALSMERHHFSREWDDAPMPYSIFFTQDGHAIHGSYEVKRLGRAVSHGCVRLAPANAAILFALVKQAGLSNTRVVLTGEAPGGGPAMAKGTSRILAEEDLDDAPPVRRSRRNGWREVRDGSRSDYYRPAPAFNSPRLFGDFPPFGWRN